MGSLVPAWAAAVVLGVLLQALPAQAQETDANDFINPDRPGIADGSNVVGAGRFQAEVGLQMERRDNGHDRALFIPTLLRLGISPNWELRVEGNGYEFTRVEDPTLGTVHSQGMPPTSIGVKYHIVDSEGPQRPSIGAILRIFPRSGSGGFQTRRTTADLRLAADWDFAPNWSLNPNVGVAVYEGDNNRQFAAGLFATTLSYNPNKALSIFVDTGVQTPEAPHGRTAMTYDCGVAYLVGRDIQLDVSAGTGAAGQSPPRPFLAAGISKRF